MPRMSPELTASLKKLRYQLVDQLPALVKNELIGAVDEGAGQTVELMQAAAPEDPDINAGLPPGTLKHGIRYALSIQAKGVRAVIKIDPAEVPYAAHVELGTQHAPAHPFFFPAWRLSKKAVKARIRKAVTKVVGYLNKNGRQ